MSVDAVAPAVAVLPYEIRLGWRPSKIPLDDLKWPLGRPGRLGRGTLSDLTEFDHLLLYPKRSLHHRVGFGTQAKVSLMVVEPAIMHSDHLRKLRKSHKRFHKVLMYHEPFLEQIPNAEFLPFGTTWVPEWETLKIVKQRDLSLIASAKRDHPGHKLRHEVIEWMRDQGFEADVLGSGYQVFDQKSDGLAPYRYSVIIENVRERNYFSEKLVDALLCETVPIYWGCPNIGDFLDTSGIVVCNSKEELQNAIKSASSSEYSSKIAALMKAKEEVIQFVDYERRAASAVLGVTCVQTS